MKIYIKRNYNSGQYYKFGQNYQEFGILYNEFALYNPVVTVGGGDTVPKKMYLKEILFYHNMSLKMKFQIFIILSEKGKFKEELLSQYK